MSRSPEGDLHARCPAARVLLRCSLGRRPVLASSTVVLGAHRPHHYARSSPEKEACCSRTRRPLPAHGSPLADVLHSSVPGEAAARHSPPIAEELPLLAGFALLLAKGGQPLTMPPMLAAAAQRKKVAASAARQWELHRSPTVAWLARLHARPPPLLDNNDEGGSMRNSRSCCSLAPCKQVGDDVLLLAASLHQIYYVYNTYIAACMEISWKPLSAQKYELL
ncbi:hypothetical protein Dimus_012989, partial [Dionaea muscipula]